MSKELENKAEWYAGVSRTEEIALAASSFGFIYRPTEKIPVIVVDSFPALGKLTAVRFIEWVQANPGGVISLPTGKTPEYFIKWVKHFLGGWHDKSVRAELEEAGIDSSKVPDIKSLRFVQMDEFYPIDSSQVNSFYYYVNKFYIKGFGLDASKAMLIDASKIGLGRDQTINDVWPDNHVDLSLRYRHAKNHLEEKQKLVLERIDQWCMEYEERIRKMGGIGFLLGGIGPDGHIGFNISGSDHNSTTRLCPTNYETQAAAAVNLGGIETARKRLVITIGLRTITRNRDCTAIIIAAGASKASVIAKAIQSRPDVDVPATVLQKLPNARFYITGGASEQLAERRVQVIESSEEILCDEEVERILVDLAVQRNKRLLGLNEHDCASDSVATVLVAKRNEPLSELALLAHNSLVRKIERGMETLEGKCFLHTEPHHDDVMLGYFAHVVRHFRRASNTHHFVTFTSGFTSVTNHFMKGQLAALRKFLRYPGFRGLLDSEYFDPGNLMYRNRDIWQYLDGIASRSEELKAGGCARRLWRKLIEIFDESFNLNLEERIKELERYFDKAYPGKHDPAYIQRLKGMCREWEAECLWGYYGWKCDNVRHLRLGFYTGDIFTKEPTMQTDVLPIVNVLKQIKPDVITVALDPEASGPDTHYKALQATAEALKVYEKQSRKKEIKIWAYRNVWYRFDTSEANIFVPVSLCMFSVMHEAFQNAFLSQKNASFPSYEHDGPFSELAQRIQVQQYQKIKTCLGREWFYNHSSPLIRATRGFVFLKEMKPEEFYQSCRELKRTIENNI
jgi:glucosamine-6-phosphate deaminase